MPTDKDSKIKSLLKADQREDAEHPLEAEVHTKATRGKRTQVAAKPKYPRVTRKRLEESPRGEQPFDMNKAITLRFQNGLSYGQIARVLEQPESTVYDKLKRFENVMKSDDELEAYKHNRAKILSSVELEMVNSLMDSGKLKKATLNNVAYTFQQVNNARRLEEGQATSHVLYADLTTKQQELHNQLQALEAQDIVSEGDDNQVVYGESNDINEL